MNETSAEQSYLQSLRDFLAERIDAAALEDAFVDAEWDDDLDSGLKNALARVRLFLSEAAQEMRPAEELKIEIIRLLASLVVATRTTSTSIDLVRGVQASRMIYFWDASTWQDAEWAEEPAAPAPPVRLTVFANRAAPVEGGVEEVQVVSEAILAV